MENQRDAVQIGVTLSTQLIAAVLTMIAVQGAFVAFILDKRALGVLGYAVIIITFLFFIGSIFIGCEGINAVRKSGFAGNWNLDCSKSQFNKQALLALFGILCFIVSVFVGNEKADDIKIKLDDQVSVIERLSVSDSLLQTAVNQLEQRLERQQHLIDSMRKMAASQAKSR